MSAILIIIMLQYLYKQYNNYVCYTYIFLYMYIDHYEVEQMTLQHAPIHACLCMCVHVHSCVRRVCIRACE